MLKIGPTIPILYVNMLGGLTVLTATGASCSIPGLIADAARDPSLPA